MAYQASTSLPYDNLGRATAGLRAALRHRVLDAGDPGLLDWSTLTVTGPEITTDDLGRPWFTWTATRPVSPWPAGEAIGARRAPQWAQGRGRQDAGGGDTSTCAHRGPDPVRAIRRVTSWPGSPAGHRGRRAVPGGDHW
ncbi:hypothetical protein [Geodermatophilus sp. FMUSA9-8]|uniref:hypothetical protein n=1 Tax=Geodermatophilus sp. FMUSA9-8 TaxID=3120155 RepID=UPI00300A20B4